VPGGPAIAGKRVAGTGLGQTRCGIRGSRIPFGALRHQRGNRHAEPPSFGTEGFCRVFSAWQPRPALAKAKSSAHDTWRRPNPSTITSCAKARGLQAGHKVAIATQLIQPVDAEIFCSWCAGGLCHPSAEGGASGAKYSRGVRLECLTTPKGASGRAARAMFRMTDDARCTPSKLPIAGSCPLIGSRYKLIVANDFHALRLVAVWPPLTTAGAAQEML